MAISLDGYKVDILAKFPDGTFSFRVPEYEDFGISFIEWRYEREEEALALYYLVRKLRECDPDRQLYLTMFYFPNARMDRVKNDDEIFTLKFFADFINSLRFSSVEILDPHSSVTPALLNNVKVLPVKPFIERAIDDTRCEDLVLFYPDEGAMKRYADLIQKPYGFGVKHRAWRTGKIIDYKIEGTVDFAGKSVLVVDDICCRGGTFHHAAKVLKAAGAEHIFLYCTHCENTIFMGELLDSDMIDHIYTTNSIFGDKHPKITVLDCSQALNHDLETMNLE